MRRMGGFRGETSEEARGVVAAAEVGTAGPDRAAQEDGDVVAALLAPDAAGAVMAHPCKVNFWGDGATSFLNQLSWFESGATQPVRTMSWHTWATICVLQFEIERATGTSRSSPAAWIGGGDFDDSEEADFRATAQALLALLVADQWDARGPNPHTHSIPAWIKSPPMSGNPEPASLTALIGGPPGPLPTPGSLLGRVRSALGST
jgi:hypothetical protein